METKEQKIERLKKEIRRNNQLRKRYKHSRYAMYLRDKNKVCRQELKELKNTVLTCDEIQELTPEEYKRQTEKVNE